RHNLALAFGLMGRQDQARQLMDADLAPAAADGNQRFYDAIRSAVAHDAAFAPPTPVEPSAPRTARTSAPTSTPMAAEKPAQPIAMAPAATAAPAAAPSSNREFAWPALDRIFAFDDGEKQAF
ncbi:MAG: hypothetical protein RIM80_25710, partial [Alphaproteobacteria bacterium]